MAITALLTPDRAAMACQTLTNSIQSSCKSCVFLGTHIRRKCKSYNHVIQHNHITHRHLRHDTRKRRSLDLCSRGNKSDSFDDRIGPQSNLSCPSRNKRVTTATKCGRHVLKRKKLLCVPPLSLRQRRTQEIPQHVMQDTAVAEVLHFDGRV